MNIKWLQYKLMSTRIVLTIFVCNDNNGITSIATSFSSRRKHCDAVVDKFFQSCQCSISFWSNHHFSCWTTIRQLCVGDCIVHYDAILIVCWNFIPLYKNASRGYIVSCDISWGSIWNYDNRKKNITSQKNRSKYTETENTTLKSPCYETEKLSVIWTLLLELFFKYIEFKQGFVKSIYYKSFNCSRNKSCKQ